MSSKSAWERATATEGTTESERILTRLARKAFLTLCKATQTFSVTRGAAMAKVMAKSWLTYWSCSATAF